MAQKTTVAVRFTVDGLAEIRQTKFVNEVSRLIVHKMKRTRSPEDGAALMRQWMRLGDDPRVFMINIWGEHDASEVRQVIAELATELEQIKAPVALDIVNV